MKLSQITLLGAVTLAVAQPHNHAHKHPARHGSPLELRDNGVTTTTVPGPVTTVYELDGQTIPFNEVEQGLAAGRYVLVGDVISTVIAPSTSTTSTSIASTSSLSSKTAAQFLEQKSTSTKPTSTYVPPTTSSTPTPTPIPTTSSTTEQAAPPTSSATHQSSGSGSSGTGLNADFPSGELDCGTFPSAYGAVAADWLKLGGWTGVQRVPGFQGLAASAISYIETAIAGTSNACAPDSFCSYACPAGYQKSQWPTAQGSTGQSIGGLYCNSNGKLELSRPSYSTLCQKGAGGVNVKSSLSKNVAICRTDYPGSESETVALDVTPGSTKEICNPDANTYYTWGGSATSAQYYINPSGVDVSDACQWGNPDSNIGNFAPTNMGVGKSKSGETFISLFQNAPTNTQGTLDFNIKITGDVSGKCEYKNGKYYSGDVESPTGCTVSVNAGGEALFVFS